MEVSGLSGWQIRRKIIHTANQLISKDVRQVVESFPNGVLAVNEAEFGYRNISKYLKKLRHNARVLEVGAGPCVLISQVKKDFPNLELTGVEPVGPGFQNFESTLNWMVDRFNFKLERKGYEDLSDDGGFDFIYLVNVLEHLSDWRHFFGFLGKNLTKGGCCVMLCPNYNFPFESHFGLPIVVNKKLTEKLFRQHIVAYEATNNCQGLWSSLNFIKKTEVMNWTKGSDQLDTNFDNSVLRQMVLRLGHDAEFASRQKGLSYLAKLGLKLGIVRLLEWPFLNRFQPYMLIEITRARK